jgi:predicted nucleic acid-binding protein
MSHLFDTNALVYYFAGLTDDDALHTLLGDSFKISIMTKIEFLGWRKHGEDAALLEKATDFLRHAVIFPLDDRIAERAIELRQQYKVKTPDAIIAATALVNDLTVITNNTRDFATLGARTRAVKLK